jgi:hypothetical protein
MLNQLNQTKDDWDFINGVDSDMYLRAFEHSDALLHFTPVGGYDTDEIVNHNMGCGRWSFPEKGYSTKCHKALFQWIVDDKKKHHLQKGEYYKVFKKQKKLLHWMKEHGVPDTCAETFMKRKFRMVNGVQKLAQPTRAQWVDFMQQYGVSADRTNRALAYTLKRDYLYRPTPYEVAYISKRDGLSTGDAEQILSELIQKAHETRGFQKAGLQGGTW